jgi:anti-sigma regulatory factor (Ser/Thr protein kinase)
MLGKQLSPPPPGIEEITVNAGSLAALRRVVQTEALVLGMTRERAWDLVMAVHELAMNSVVHGGGHGSVAIWRDGDAIACQVRDSGVINDPMIGRSPPLPLGTSGRGIWIVRQLCDFVQVHSLPRGTLVRVSMSLTDD